MIKSDTRPQALCCSNLTTPWVLSHLQIWHALKHTMDCITLLQRHGLVHIKLLAAQANQTSQADTKLLNGTSTGSEPAVWSVWIEMNQPWK